MAAPIPERVAELEQITLDHGAHDSADDGMCVAEAMTYVTGQPFSDRPACVSLAIAAFLRRWNDALPVEPRQLLKPYVLKALNTATGPEHELRRSWLAADWLIRTAAPAWLERAGLEEDARQLRQLPELTSIETYEPARPLIQMARAHASKARIEARDRLRKAAWAAEAAEAAWAAEAAGKSLAKIRQEARAAAEAAFAELIGELQGSAFELLDRMIAVGRSEPESLPE